MPGGAPGDTIGGMTARQPPLAAPPQAREHLHRRILMRIIALSAALWASLALAAGPAGAHKQPGQLPRGTVWVTDKNPTARSVAAFDARTGELRGLVPVGLSPIGIVAPRGTDEVYVSNEGSNTMSVIDRHSLREMRTIAIGSKPHHLIASRDGRFVYVGEFGQNSIAVIDTR